MDILLFLFLGLLRRSDSSFEGELALLLLLLLVGGLLRLFKNGLLEAEGALERAGEKASVWEIEVPASREVALLLLLLLLQLLPPLTRLLELIIGEGRVGEERSLI